MSHAKTRRHFAGFAALCAVGVICLGLFSNKGQTDDLQSHTPDEPAPVDKELISAHLGRSVVENSFPDAIELNVNGKLTRATVQYGLESAAHEKMVKLFSAYKPDYGAFVAMDATTGRLLSLISFSRENRVQGNLALKASFPAASIFKVVTASAALDLDKANPDTVVPFNGANHTLYKRNVQDMRQNRWTRRLTMREAFGRSVNTFFGKLGLFYVGPRDLIAYAERFRFNQPIHSDIPVEAGFARIAADDPWSVVTAASGFTRDNTLSPVHGAMIGAAVANDGVMMEPYLVESLADEGGMQIYRAEPREASVAVEPRSAAELRVLMRETIRSGTSRRAFRQVNRRNIFDGAEVGGKTGSLTGGEPMGKCDWFVGYMRYKGTRVAVAALTVNEEKWRVKSSFLAGSFFESYLRDLKSRERATARLDSRDVR